MSPRCDSSLATTVDKKEIESKSMTCERYEDGFNQLQKEMDSLKESMIYAKVENKLIREQKDKELLKQFEEMQTKLNSVMGAVKTGVSYVRWGRTTCPTPSTKVYTGNSRSDILLEQYFSEFISVLSLSAVTNCEASVNSESKCFYLMKFIATEGRLMKYDLNVCKTLFIIGHN